MAEIIRITSESLQEQIRTLLPSQQGFGEDLQASNVILPIIDLTATAAGETIPGYLQTALAFGSQTSIQIANTTSTVVNNAGFYRIFGTFSMDDANSTANLSLTDGLSSKIILRSYVQTSGTANRDFEFFDFNIYLDSGESLTGTTNSANAYINVTSRQLADTNGNLVNPSGYSPQ